jgi:hypothetical protein
VHRWIADARARIVAETRRKLAERLRASPGELDSLIRLAQLGNFLGNWHRFLGNFSRRHRRFFHPRPGYLTISSWGPGRSLMLRSASDTRDLRSRPAADIG